ncbi:TIR domain-containing protein [Sorangium sp. So ce363]|uniref:WD40 domain-containing protein n=1 Tax=Sorangium sp. So ce363 TaxID=3133304 RepID=UPI003F6059FE
MTSTMTPERSAREPPPLVYDGFISYSHTDDRQLASAVQASLQRYARRWYRTRALRIYRDETNLQATPGLWQTIVAALERSRYFLLMASPKAASSPWVGKELRWWLKNCDPSRIFVVLTYGEIVWDQEQSDFDWSRTTAIPRVAERAFKAEPLYIDLRWARADAHLSLSHSEFRRTIAKLAAPLHGLDLDEMEGEEVRQHRNTVWIVRTTVIVLIALAVTSTVFWRNSVRYAQIATQERDAAQRETASLYLERAISAASQSDWNAAAVFFSTARTFNDSEQASWGAGIAESLIFEPIVKLRAPSALFHVAGPTIGGHFSVTRQLGIGVSLWDLDTAREISMLQTSQEFAYSCSVSMDGALLASATKSGAVIVWDVRSGKETHRWRVPADYIDVEISHDWPVVTFSPDGHLLAAAVGLVAHVFDLEQDREIKQLKDSEHIRMMSFAPDARSLALGSMSGLRLWNVIEESAEASSVLDPRPVTAVQFSPDGGVVAAAGLDHVIRIWNARTRVPATHLRGHDAPIVSLSFSPDGSYIASASEDWTVGVWDVRGGVMARLTGHTGPVSSVLWFDTSKGPRIVSTGMDGILLEWAPRLQRADSLIAAEHAPTRLAFSSDGHILATAGRTIKLWDVDSRREIKELRPEDGHRVARLAFLAKDTKLLSAEMENGVALWDPASVKVVQRWSYPGWVEAVAVAPDGRTIAWGGTASDGAWDSPAHLFDLASGFELAPLRGHVGKINDMAFSPDGNTLATACADGSVRLWDYRNARAIKTFRHDDEVFAVTFSASGKHLATAVRDRTVQVWDVATEKREHEFRLEQWPQSVSFSPGGHLLATGDAGGTLHVWDLSRKDALLRLRNFGTYVFSAGFAPTGMVLAASDAERVHLFTTSRDAPLDQQQRILRAVRVVVEGARLATAEPVLISPPASDAGLPHIEAVPIEQVIKELEQELDGSKD